MSEPFGSDTGANLYLRFNDRILADAKPLSNLRGDLAAEPDTADFAEIVWAIWFAKYTVRISALHRDTIELPVNTEVNAAEGVILDCLPQARVILGNMLARELSPRINIAAVILV